jgi:hypothetical protein
MSRNDLFYTLATSLNLLAAAVSLGFGFYIVTRSPRSRVSWLAALTLWAVASLFLHNTVAINVPESGVLLWLRPVALLVVPLWLHLTVTLHPDSTRLGGRTPSAVARRSVIIVAYALAFALIIGGVIPAGLSPGAEIGTAAYLSGRTSSALYPLTIPFLLVLGLPSLLNLWHARRDSPDRRMRQQFTLLLVASGLAGLAGLYFSLGVWLRLDVPTLPGDAVLAAGVILLGYAVARYNALLEVRTIQRDFVYAALAVAILTGLYYVATLTLYYGGHVSFLALMLVVVVAISSHALYDGVRVALDRIFYREQFRRLRANLQILAREAGTGQPLADQLQAVLRTLCRSLRIQGGFVALSSATGFKVEAAHRVKLENPDLPTVDMNTTEIVDLPREGIRAPNDMRLLVPLFAAGEQVGALVLGPKESDQPYSEEDLDLLDDLSDQIAIVIHTSRVQEQNARAINTMVADFRARERALQQQVQQVLAEREEQTGPVLGDVTDKQFTAWVEDGLRRLHDFSYLGQHPFAQLQVVNWQLANHTDTFVTHIDRGKALNEILLQAMYKLRPEGKEPSPHQIPPREWHQFIVLHDAYNLDEPNRDIMSRLYIGEGTFARTRRRALRGVAKALQEMEQEARKRESRSQAS